MYPVASIQYPVTGITLSNFQNCEAKLVNIKKINTISEIKAA